MAEVALTIPPDAQLKDGIRTLLVHHLALANVKTLSGSQEHLFEYHLGRLTTYGQMIIQTMSFAQQALESGAAERAAEARRQAEEARAQAEAEAQAQAQAAAAAAAAAAEEAKQQKKLRLSDREILAICGAAQREAELEADWRGIDAGSSPFRYRAAVVSETPPRKGGTLGEGKAVSPVVDKKASRERAEALDLMMEALQGAAREAEVALDVAPDDLATRLLPARPVRPCDVAMQRAGTMCCATVLAEEGGLPDVPLSQRALPKQQQHQQQQQAALPEPALRGPQAISPLPALPGGRLQSSTAPSAGTVAGSAERPLSVSGTWHSNEGETMLINGYTILWPDGSTSTLVPQGRDSVMLTLEGRVYWARCAGDDLIWNDGAVWRRGSGGGRLDAVYGAYAVAESGSVSSSAASPVADAASPLGAAAAGSMGAAVPPLPRPAPDTGAPKVSDGELGIFA